MRFVTDLTLHGEEAPSYYTGEITTTSTVAWDGNEVPKYARRKVFEFAIDTAGYLSEYEKGVRIALGLGIGITLIEDL